jgi:TRAP transporter 4TM/12TM fusion protein
MSRAADGEGEAPLRLVEDDPAAVAALVEEHESERPARKLTGWARRVVQVLAAGLSVYALYWVLNPVPAQIYRTSFLAVALAMTFLVYRGWGGRKEGRADNPGLLDWAVAALSVVALGYTLVDFEAFVRRAVIPTPADVAFGAITVLLVLEAARRTVGWILPAIVAAFLAYAWLGGMIPADWPVSHQGYDLDRLVGQTYMGLEGIFGTPLDVAATYIVLFTLYGAVLEFSGAGQYFIDVSAAAFGRSRAGPGRTTAAAGFLLGTVSGSGTATAVTLGSVAWPLLKRAGYPPDAGGGVLAAAGIGAILSPPTLGAAAFIIAELLGISYLKVLVYALVPSLLYYLGVLLAIEADARRLRAAEVAVEAPPLSRLIFRYGYHFSSLVLIVVLMALGFSPFRAVAVATLIAFLLSFLDPAHAIGPKRAWQALAAGAMGVIPVAATTAAAGIIVAVVTLTGLGLKLSGLIVGAAGGSLALTAVYAAVAVLVLGLAVPVTASFIIASVVIAPALTHLGVEPYVAYMFIFYYAVLSEVTPPTALAAVAASAITGGDAYRTMMATWKYTLPAFLVPFAFVLSKHGEGVLLQGPVAQIALAVAASALSVAALSFAVFGWLGGRARWPERVLAAVAAVALLTLEIDMAGVGLAVLALALGLHLLRRRKDAPR